MTDKPKGTGLGLPICVQIIEHHRGKIWVDSEPGKGSTFSFSLPFRPDEKQESGFKAIDLAAVIREATRHAVTVAEEVGKDWKTILVVDDEDHVRNLFRQELEAVGYQVKEAKNGLEAIRFVRAEKPDLVILDVMMPNMDGLETIKRVREKSSVPIIVLSALGEEQDKVRALNLGADDYLSKPFGVKELLARLNAVQRRAQWGGSSIQEEKIAYGDISIDVNSYILKVRGNQIEVTPTEFNLLVILIRNAGKVLNHKMLLQNVWGPEYGQETEYLRVYIGRLRQKIEKDASHPEYLHTEHGIGYCFEMRASK